eukprot:CAMPEP_0182536480 /NCGR_PEP_ID=MMETSP1323-20130603/20092_1 /TAXON_ID=236787 /ORGANISM="Florenciella parvula, Strain RCC1693" /LENGTH=182 /DNA_ID=CAMNT_0024746725 /DNA_START=91 /DNA_END=635 /DNA_ORIENTATION=+
MPGHLSMIDDLSVPTYVASDLRVLGERTCRGRRRPVRLGPSPRSRSLARSRRRGGEAVASAAGQERLVAGRARLGVGVLQLRANHGHDVGAILLPEATKEKEDRHVLDSLHQVLVRQPLDGAFGEEHGVYVLGVEHLGHRVLPRTQLPRVRAAQHRRLLALEEQVALLSKQPLKDFVAERLG